MEQDDEMLEEARERAERALNYKTEDGKWDVLMEALATSVTRQREAAIEILTVELIRDNLYPGISRERWKRLGWSNALGGRIDPNQFVHNLRLARAAGSKTGKL